MTERLHFHFSLSCIGEGNGKPLQYSCLENPRDGGAWWASIYGVAQSRTPLKQLSSSSSSKWMQRPCDLWINLYWKTISQEHWYTLWSQTNPSRNRSESLGKLLKFFQLWFLLINFFKSFINSIYLYVHIKFSTLSGS